MSQELPLIKFLLFDWLTYHFVHFRLFRLTFFFATTKHLFLLFFITRLGFLLVLVAHIPLGESGTAGDASSIFPRARWQVVRSGMHILHQIVLLTSCVVLLVLGGYGWL